MTMSYQRADDTLQAALNTETADDVYLWLHTGDPGADGTAAVAKQPDGTTDIVRKAVSFASPENHGTNDERRCLSDSSVEWTGEEIDDGQEITHFSIWSDDEGGQPEFVSGVVESKTVGSDGVTVGEGDIECAIEVHEKPA